MAYHIRSLKRCLFCSTLCFFFFCALLVTLILNAETIRADGEPQEQKDGGNRTPIPLTKLLNVDDEELKKRMVSLFGFIDKDNSKTLTKEEIISWVQFLRKRVNERQGLLELKSIDKDGDGKVSFEELKAAQLESDEPLDEQASEDLMKRFKAVDKNGDGFLSVEEMTLFLYPANDPELLAIEIEYIFEAHDKDKDRHISVEEFMHSDQSDEELSEAEKTQLMEQFKMIDKDGDGLISENEIKEAVADPGHQEAETAAGQLVKDSKDEVITEEEWVLNHQKYAASALTDNGELIRFPEDYAAGLPFKNVQKRDDGEHDGARKEDEADTEDEHEDEAVHEEL